MVREPLHPREPYRSPILGEAQHRRCFLLKKPITHLGEAVELDIQRHPYAMLDYIHFFTTHTSYRIGCW